MDQQANENWAGVPAFHSSGVIYDPGQEVSGGKISDPRQYGEWDTFNANRCINFEFH